LNHSSDPFFVGYFQDRVLWTLSPGCIWTVILLISASRVAKITGVSHQRLAVMWYFQRMLSYYLWTCACQASALPLKPHPHPSYNKSCIFTTFNLTICKFYGKLLLCPCWYFQVLWQAAIVYCF
jgi:hypothetical protein